MRLIDADALKEWFKNHVIIGSDGKMRYSGKYLESIIDEQPTVEAEPVRHGRWEERKWEDAKAGSGLHTIASARCSECGLWCEQVRD